MNPLHFDLEMEALKERSIDRLITAEVCDRAAFERLLQYLDARAVELRAEYVLPKQFLSCLRDGAGYIRSRAEHVPSAQAALDLAHKFELLLDLSIKGESLADRRPGVPRII